MQAAVAMLRKGIRTCIVRLDWNKAICIDDSVAEWSSVGQRRLG
jgi:hypothetical protein